MKKMELMVNKDKMRCSAAVESIIRELGFLLVRLKVKGQDGKTHKTNECLYFAEGLMNTLVSLRALKHLECFPENFLYPAAKMVSFLTERDNRDEEEETEEEVSIPRQPTPARPDHLPFPLTQ